MRRFLIAVALLFAASPALAQTRGNVFNCPLADVGSVMNMMQTGRTEWRCIKLLGRVDTVWLAGPIVYRDTGRVVVMPAVVETVYVARPDTVTPPVTTPASAEPSGMTVYSERAFDAVTETGWGFAGRFSVASDASAPFSGPSVGQITYPAGFSGGSAPGQTYPTTQAQSRTVYVRWHVKLSPNFQNHSTGTNKLAHFYIAGLNRLFVQARGTNLAPSIGLQSIAAPFNGGTSTNLTPNVVTGATLTRGEWHKLELVLVANTPGVADGSVTLWQNGVRVLHYDGITYTASGTSGRWEGANISPTWGGTGDSVTSEMWLRMDHIYMSRK